MKHGIITVMQGYTPNGIRIPYIEVMVVNEGNADRNAITHDWDELRRRVHYLEKEYGSLPWSWIDNQVSFVVRTEEDWAMLRLTKF